MAGNNPRLVERTLEVLSALARRNDSVGIGELAAECGLSPSTVFRILATLCEFKAASRIAKGRYQIGPLVLFWAQAYNRKTGLVRAAERLAERLWRESGETVNIFYLEDGWQMYFLKRLRSPQPISTNCRMGGRIELYSSAAGRAVLSAHPDRDIEEYLEATPLVRITPRTAIDRHDLWRKIMAARHRGYGAEMEENEPGVRCVGSVILGADGRPWGAISVTAPVFRMGNDRARDMGILTRETARNISLEMGWRDPEATPSLP